MKGSISNYTNCIDGRFDFEQGEKSTGKIKYLSCIYFALHLKIVTIPRVIFH